MRIPAGCISHPDKRDLLTHHDDKRYYDKSIRQHTFRQVLGLISHFQGLISHN